MVILLKKFVLLAFVATIAGCAAVGPTYKPVELVDSGKGVVYVYRPATHALSILSAIVDVNDKPLASLENNGYAALVLPVGTYTMKQSWKAGLLGSSNLEGKPIYKQVTVTSDKPAYIRLVADASSSSKSRGAYNRIDITTHFSWALQAVPQAEAEAEIAQCKQAVAAVY